MGSIIINVMATNISNLNQKNKKEHHSITTYSILAVTMDVDMATIFDILHLVYSQTYL